MIVIFEGFDKTGKSTLKAAFDKATDYKYTTIDRFTFSNRFYDIYFGRQSDERYDSYAEDVLSVLSRNNYVVVYCVASTFDIVQRHIIANEEIPIPSDVLKFDTIDKDYFNIIKDWVPEKYILKTNTSFYSIEKCVDAIKRHIEEFNK